ncbi:MAG: hypothetical protein GH142_06450 [Dehalococcoidia bacterium]|nr:hypothetical protein [Dehalococcoidia bacterium]
MATQSNWFVQQFRFSFFTPPNESFDSDQLAQSFGAEFSPEVRTSNTREGTEIISGPFADDLSLKLIRHKPANRTDLIFGPRQVPPEPGHPIGIGYLEETLEPFRLAILEFLRSSHLPNIIRIAYGVTLVQSGADEEATKNILGQYVSAIDLNDAAAGDLIYRMNRPRDSTIIPDLLLNRISDWRLPQELLFQFTGTQQTISSSENILNLCQVQLDINTDLHRRDSFDSSKLPELFNELIDLGNELAEHGDNRK